MMTAISVNLLESYLLHQREHLRTHIRKLEDSIQQSNGHEAYDLVDDATWTTEQAKIMALLRHAKRSLQHVEDALAKLASRTYGICECCGMPIDLARLEILLHANLCVGCQQHREYAERVGPHAKSAGYVLSIRRKGAKAE